MFLGSFVLAKRVCCADVTRRGCMGRCFGFAGVHPPSRCALGPQRPLALARPLSPMLTHRGQTNACFLVWVHKSRTRFALCDVPPSRLRSAGPPRLDAAPPGGGLLSSAFLASVVRIHGRRLFWAAKSEPKRGYGQLNSHPLGGAALAAGVRPSAARKKTHAKHTPSSPTTNLTPARATLRWCNSACARSRGVPR